MLHGFNIVGRVRKLAKRREYGNPAERERAQAALIAIHEILKGEGLES
jgi:hypothetical protein